MPRIGYRTSKERPPSPPPNVSRAHKPAGPPPAEIQAQAARAIADAITGLAQSLTRAAETATGSLQLMPSPSTETEFLEALRKPEAKSRGWARGWGANSERVFPGYVIIPRLGEPVFGHGDPTRHAPPYAGTGNMYLHRVEALRAHRVLVARMAARRIEEIERCIAEQLAADARGEGLNNGDE